MCSSIGEEATFLGGYFFFLSIKSKYIIKHENTKKPFLGGYNLKYSQEILTICDMFQHQSILNNQINEK